jgi:hypothetical protein
MLDDRLRREAQRLRRAQEIADGLRERRAELLAELRYNAVRARKGPLLLDAYRKPRKAIFGLPDDAG